MPNVFRTDGCIPFLKIWVIPDGAIFISTKRPYLMGSSSFRPTGHTWGDHPYPYNLSGPFFIFDLGDLPRSRIHFRPMCFGPSYLKKWSSLILEPSIIIQRGAGINRVTGQIYGPRTVEWAYLSDNKMFDHLKGQSSTFQCCFIVSFRQCDSIIFR